MAPAARSIAHRLMGGAAADRIASTNTNAALRAGGMPMNSNTVATSPPTTSIDTLPAPVMAPGTSMTKASRKSMSHFML